MKKDENNKFEKSAPEYTGNGVAVWKNKNRDGKEYLSIKLVGHRTVSAFKNEKEK